MLAQREQDIGNSQNQIIQVGLEALIIEALKKFRATFMLLHHNEKSSPLGLIFLSKISVVQNKVCIMKKACNSKLTKFS